MIIYDHTFYFTCLCDRNIQYVTSLYIFEGSVRELVSSMGTIYYNMGFRNIECITCKYTYIEMTSFRYVEHIFKIILASFRKGLTFCAKSIKEADFKIFS